MNYLYLFSLVLLMFMSETVCDSKITEVNAEVITESAQNVISPKALLSSEEVRNNANNDKINGGGENRTEEWKPDNNREDVAEMTTAVMNSDQSKSNNTEESGEDFEERTDLSSEQIPSADNDAPDVWNETPQWPLQFYPRYETEFPFVTKLHPTSPHLILSCRSGFFLYNDLCVRSLYFR